jgi:voltage-gated potassium channel Kch
VICRSGSPIDLNDLDIVNPQASRSIIILSPEDEDPDSQVIKTILALTHHPDRRAESYHVVAEIREPKHMEIAHIVGRDETKLVLASDLISRITVQTSRQSGLSVVYTTLLNFEDDGIYFVAEPALVGRSYADALSAYEDSSVMGLLHGDRDVALNPPMETVIAPDDNLVVLSRSDNTIKLGKPVNLEINDAAICAVRPYPTNAERTLILGWNDQSVQIMCELDKYVAPGSEALIVSDCPEGEGLAAAAGKRLQHLKVTHQTGDITERTVLEALNIQNYDHVIILSAGSAGGVQKADALTLVTLLHLRSIADRYGHKFSIVTEMMDGHNRRLAEVTRADDFIVSDMLTGLMLAQVSENKHLMDVFTDLFDADGASIYLKPATHYVMADQPVNFYTIVESAIHCGETAIGYRLAAQANDSAKSYGVVLNPHKTAKITFAEGDRVIVLQS